MKSRKLCPIPILMLFTLFLPLTSVSADINDDLLKAAENGQTKKVRALLEDGADVNAKGEYGATALILAATGGRTETVKVLLDAGADTNLKNAEGHTALSLAQERGHAKIVEMLKKAGAKE